MGISTTGRRLKQIMEEEGLRQVDILNKTKSLQKKYDITVRKSDLSQYVNDKVTPRQDKLFILAAALEVDEAWLMGYDVPRKRKEKPKIPTRNINDIYKRLNSFRQNKVYNYAKHQLEDQRFELREAEEKYKIVPLVGITAANPSEVLYGDPMYDEQVDTDVPKNAERALIVKGDSMEPEYEDGDIVFYRLQPDVENGEIAIVEIDGNGVTCKKVIKEEGKILLRSLNKDYPDREVEAEKIRILGKVVK